MSFWASMTVRQAQDVSGTGPKPSLDDATASSFSGVPGRLVLARSDFPCQEPCGSRFCLYVGNGHWAGDKTLRRKSAASSLPERLSPPPLVSDASQCLIHRRRDMIAFPTDIGSQDVSLN